MTNPHTASRLRFATVAVALIAGSLTSGVISLAFSAGLTGAEDEQIVRAKVKYSFDSWEKGPRRHGLHIEDIRFAGYEADSVRALPSGMVTRTYRGTDGRSPILVEIFLRDTVEQAHLDLVENIAFVSSTKQLPTTAQEGMAIGDLGYIGYSGAGPGKISWIAWVDGNVSVRLCCNDPRLSPAADMPGLAEQLSAAIRKEDELKGSAPLSHPEILSLEASASECKAGEELRLTFTAHDDNGQVWHSQWHLRGDAQGYVERDRGGWVLTTTSKGTMVVELTVMGPLGTLATRTVTIEVADED